MSQQSINSDAIDDQLSMEEVPEETNESSVML